MKKLIILASLALLAAACSVKGNGERFYAEPRSADSNKYFIVHSSMHCPLIKNGTFSEYLEYDDKDDVYYGFIDLYHYECKDFHTFCPKCMDKKLILKYNEKYGEY